MSDEGRADDVGVPEGVRRSGAGGLREEAMVDMVEVRAGGDVGESVREQEMRDEAEGLKEVTTQPRRDLASDAKQGLGAII
jgi:hypothetical protein